jgi:hypothetical protein
MAGHRVMDTIGRKITTLTNTRGFAVDFAAATTVMMPWAVSWGSGWHGVSKRLISELFFKLFYTGF